MIHAGTNGLCEKLVSFDLCTAARDGTIALCAKDLCTYALCTLHPVASVDVCPFLSLSEED